MVLPALAQPPPRTAIVDKEGRLTPEGMRWFDLLWRKTGQASDTAPLNITGNSENINGLLSSLNQVANAQLNSTNFCTVDSIDAGSDATIRVYGVGGVGTSWTRKVGNTTQGPFPSGTFPGKAYTTDFYVAFNPTTLVYVVSENYPDILADGLVWVGKVTTVDSGGGGGSSGGGGSGGGFGGCVEVGTPCEDPPGTIVRRELCSEWVVIDMGGGQTPLVVAPDTLVSVWKRARQLGLSDLIDTGTEGEMAQPRCIRREERNSVKEKRKCPGGVYRARGIRLHNMKPL